MITLNTATTLSSYFRANYYKLTSTWIDIAFLSFFGVSYIITFIFGMPLLGFGIVGFLAIFFIFVPLLKFLYAKSQGISSIEYYFDQNTFGVKIGPYSTGISVDFVREIRILPKGLRIKLKRGHMYVFADTQQTLTQVVDRLSKTDYAKFLVD